MVLPSPMLRIKAPQLIFAFSTPNLSVPASTANILNGRCRLGNRGAILPATRQTSVADRQVRADQSRHDPAYGAQSEPTSTRAKQLPGRHSSGSGGAKP